MGTTTVSAPSGEPYVDISREFAAPRELLYRAYMEPDLLCQWLGPRRFEMVIDRFEARDGGSWRFVHRDGEGNEFWFHGVFHSTSIDNMVQTFEFEGAPGHVSLDSLVFEEHEERTIVRTHSVFQSIADRDAMVEAGMAVGVNEGFERLEELLGRIAVPAGR